MKRQDILLMVVCVSIGAILSLLLSNVLFGESTRQEKVEVVEKITPEFTQPDQRYFNDQSLNPTQLIQIGNGTTQVKFGQ